MNEIRAFFYETIKTEAKKVPTYTPLEGITRHINMGCLCLDERLAHPNFIKDGVIVTLQITQTGSEGMVSRSSYAMFPYMHRNTLL